MRRLLLLLLPIALLATAAPNPAPPPAAFTIYEGTCAHLGTGLVTYSFDPFPAQTEISVCFSVPHGTGTVMRFEGGAPSTDFSCVAYAFNNNYCGTPGSDEISGMDKERCADATLGIYSYTVSCQGKE
ncbi:hypothetical protein Tdes44962_MAKER05539 [Teratosphaeria destructans]|uniref:Uncharacterized protein n=1 Tax=Teratosphaeria destructans TaxID=418781 RepID=A0A9W7VYM0_9PEZI|nr:hypothetical protein Tdes44962_MAKER05539 [Teratosphaeria destructans]